MTQQLRTPGPEDDARHAVDAEQPPGAPRWLKLLILAGVVVVALLLVVMLLAGGNHGPGRHLPPAGVAVSRASST
jgi:hypothetical protein